MDEQVFWLLVNVSNKARSEKKSHVHSALEAFVDKFSPSLHGLPCKREPSAFPFYLITVQS